MTSSTGMNTRNEGGEHKEILSVRFPGLGGDCCTVLYPAARKADVQKVLAQPWVLCNVR